MTPKLLLTHDYLQYCAIESIFSISSCPLSRCCNLLQDALVPQELVQETILLQEVLLTAHMARAYEFPTLVRLMCAVIV